MSILREISEANLQALYLNPYPGRGIIQGRTPDGSPVQVYWVMGRSEGSRNRILELVSGYPGWLRTRIADEAGFSGNPDLLIYTAMAEDAAGTFAVSNGDQTEDVAGCGITVLKNGGWQYEPDDPNFTPRITGMIRYMPAGNTLEMRLTMLRKSQFSDECDYFEYNYSRVAPGYGCFISTYEGDGNPLPSFRGEPRVMPIAGIDPAEIAVSYWSALNRDNRVAVAVKMIHPDLTSDIEIINRHDVA